MTTDSTSLGKLALSSMRLNRGVLILVGVAVVLVGTCAWALQRLLDVEVNKVDYHFSRLVESLNENRLFLSNVNSAVNDAQDVLTKNITPLQSRLVFHGAGVNIYEGKEFSFSTPFNLAQSDASETVSQTAFSLGMHLANFYSEFWSGSVVPSPQLFLLPSGHEFTLAVPAIGARRGHAAILSLESYLETSKGLLQLFKERQSALQEGQVYWANTGNVSEGNAKVFGFIKINLPTRFLRVEGDDREVLLAALINVRRLSETPTSVDTPAFDDLTLIAPSGEVLLGRRDENNTRPDGMRFTSSGLEMKVASDGDERWTAVYRISYDSFFHYAKWQLLSIFGVALLCVYVGWLVNRWYRLRVVRPAEQAHRRVIESEIFSRAVIDTAPTGLCVVRQSDNRMLLANKRAQTWLGNSQYISRLIREQQADMGEACVEVGGRYLHVSFSSTRYQGQDVIVCAFSDVTGHKDDAAALTRARQQAEEASQAKTTFLATMSHEIRTPLNAIIGMLELVLTRKDNAELNTQSVHIAYESANHLLALIGSILDISRIESGKLSLSPEPTRIKELLESTSNVFSGLARQKRLYLRLDIAPLATELVWVDALKVKQIISNLLSNAIKFTEQGGIEIRCQVSPASKTSLQVVISVSDTGVGIPAAQIDQIFNPFFITRDAINDPNAGAGLGLAICKELSNFMGGHLEVESDTKFGTQMTFSIVLECVSAETHVTSPVSGSTADKSLDVALTLLIVEDHLPSQYLLYQQLSYLGHRVVTASNGLEGLAMWQENEIDIVLTDANMPQMSGIEMTQSIRRLEQSRGVRPCIIIGLTADAQREALERCLASGMDHALTKPITLADLNRWIPKLDTDEQQLKNLPSSTSTIHAALAEQVIESNNSELEALQRALDKEDLKEMERVAHKLKGTAYMLNHSGLLEQCIEVEELCADGMMSINTLEAVTTLMQSLEAINQALRPS